LNQDPISPKTANGGGKRLVLSPRDMKSKIVVLSPNASKATMSLQDRIKLFNTNTPLDSGGAQAAKSKRQEQSKKRHEMRKKKAKTTAAPTKIKNVAAKPIGNLDKFVPPVFEKDQSDVKKIQVSLEANFIFENLDDNDLDILIKAFEKISVHKGNQIIKQGDAGDFFYIIGRGKVTFEVNGNTVGEASAGKSFGELALLYTSPRAASAIATAQPTQLYRVDQKTFRYIMQTKAKESEGEKMKLLRTISFLKDLSDDDLQRLCSCMVLRKFEADEQIVTKGEEGNDFYIVHKGSVRVTDIAVGNSTYDDVTLQPGAHFGERALVTSEPRAANVIGAEVGSCFVIDRPVSSV